jgi:hypothetical protein
MKGSRRLVSTLVFALAVGVTVPSCVVRGSARVSGGALVVYDAPPEPQYEEVTVRPGYVFIHGRWNWQGGRWVWMAGHWERERSGYQWERGQWVRRGNSWHWVEGRWIVHSGGGGHVGGGGSTTVITDPGGGGGTVVRDHRGGGGGGGGATITVGQYPTAPPPALQVENVTPRRGYIFVAGRCVGMMGFWAWVRGLW